MTFSPIPHTDRVASTLHAEPRPSLDALFSYGFRPFFLGAALYAALAMTAWTVWIACTHAGLLSDWLPVAGSPYSWHAHEMLFGFAAAAIGGFLLTAVPNWTGTLPLSGAPLVFLFSTWLLGRLAMGVSGLLPYPLVIILDVAFLPILGGFAARQLFTRPALRNLVFLVLVAALTICNLIFHLGNGGYLSIDPLAAVRASVLVVILMIAVIGGRIIPAFTHNWLNNRGKPERMPQRVPWLEKTALISLVLFVVLSAFGAPDVLAGVAALIAAVANGTRLVLWRGAATAAEPIVWILHLGYGWIVTGLALSALAALTGAIPGAIVTHAFATGAVGTMIIAVMTRASLGHTGRPLVAPPRVVWVYYLITLAGLLRVAGPLVAPAYYVGVLLAAALAWIAAFSLFVIVYAPILTTPRVHTKVPHR